MFVVCVGRTKFTDAKPGLWAAAAVRNDRVVRAS